MRKLLTLLFSILISFNSYGYWNEIESTDKYTFYIDDETIKTVDKYVYYWTLTDNNVPNKNGTLSTKLRKQGDCKLERVKPLSFIFYKKNMGKGSLDTYTPEESEWWYDPPGSIGSYELAYVCEVVKLTGK
jgi:hypothetical protein